MKDFLKETAFTDVKSVKQNSAESAGRPVTYDALILDARLRQSLVTARSLGERGLRVAASEISTLKPQSRHIPTFSSRWCSNASFAPTYEREAEPFLAYLKELLHTTGARVLITSSDGTLAVIREHRAELERYTQIALAQNAALDAAINKDVTLEIAQRLGVAIPGGVTVRSVDDVTDAIHEIGLPAVVKPVETWLWQNKAPGHQQGVRLICQLVTTPDEARQAVEELTQSGGTVLFQQFLSGSREAVSLLYAKKEIYARFAQWAKRTQPPLGGTSVYRKSIALPEDIGRQAELLVREIELEGYSEVEFRRDDFGKPYLMEINPRLSASVEVAVRSGVDFPYLLYQWANGDRINRVMGYRTGRWMRFLEGDILTTAQAIMERGRPGVTPPAQAVLEFCSAFFVPAGYDYIDWKDLFPAWTAALDFFSRAGRKIRKKSSRRTDQ